MTADTFPVSAMDRVSGWFKRAQEVLDVMSGTPRILGLIWRANPKLCLAVIVLNLIMAFIPLCEMELTRAILDAVTGGVGTPFGAAWALTLLGLGTALTLIYFVASPSMWVCQEHLADLLTRDINLLLLDKANSLVDIALFETPEFYDKLETAWRQSGHKPINLLNDLCGLLRQGGSVLAMLFLLLTFQPLIVLVVIAFSLPQMIEEVRSRKLMWAMHNYEMPEVRKMAYYQSILTRDHNAKEVRLFGLGDFFLQRYLTSFNEYLVRHKKLRNDHWRNTALLAVIASFGTAVPFIYVTLAALSQAITVGSYTLYVSAIDRLRWGVQGLLHSLSSLYESNLYAKNLFEFLSVQSTMEQVPQEFARNLQDDKPVSIEFCNVGFHYPKAEKAVFSNLSFKIEPGQTVAMVGQNGAGKTTIVKLLARLYDPTGGKILIDGVDLREYDLERWRSHVGVILQDYSRYYLSARENIGVGQLQLIEEMDAVKAAAERGGAAEMIEELEGKYDTVLGRIFSPEHEKGSELSGGQWQKVALSRAFMRSLAGSGCNKDVGDAQLLILDEPTSSLDAEAEYDVFKRFSELTRGKTTVLISHRFSTVRMADLILVMSDGLITEQGSHEELLALGGEYARLFNMQADRYR